MRNLIARMRNLTDGGILQIFVGRNHFENESDTKKWKEGGI